jgi:hypothetical protein
MNNTITEITLNPCGFKESIGQTEIRLVDVTKMIPIEKPAALLPASVV